MRAGLIWNVVGWLALSLAGIGVVLPIMPTVPFLLVAAWAFAKSSPELRQRIRNHPRYGKAVRDWQDRGAVPRLAKDLGNRGHGVRGRPVGLDRGSGLCAGHSGDGLRGGCRFSDHAA